MATFFSNAINFLGWLVCTKFIFALSFLSYGNQYNYEMNESDKKNFKGQSNLSDREQVNLKIPIVYIYFRFLRFIFRDGISIRHPIGQLHQNEYIYMYECIQCSVFSHWCAWKSEIKRINSPFGSLLEQHSSPNFIYRASDDGAVVEKNCQRKQKKYLHFQFDWSFRFPFENLFWDDWTLVVSVAGCCGFL